LHHRLEARTLRRADAIVTVTEGWGQRFRALYPQVPCRVIRNGHALDRVSGRGPGTFRILYTGKLDLVEQDPTPLLEGLRAWLARSPPPQAEILFHLYGAGAESAESALRASGLPIACGGPLGQRASEEAQTGAAVLIAFSWRRDPDCVPAKLYDYLASRRRILVLGSARSEMARLVREADVGASAETGPEVAAVLGRFYAEWQGGAWEPAGAMRAAEEFAFERRADEYEALLRELTGPRGTQA
jgi:glycosyltransferase involved in cell wall biosynthesis